MILAMGGVGLAFVAWGDAICQTAGLTTAAAGGRCLADVFGDPLLNLSLSFALHTGVTR